MAGPACYAGWPRSKTATLFLAELALDRAITLRQEAAQQAVPARARRQRRRRPGFAGVLEGLASEDGCLDACLHSMGQFHVQVLKVHSEFLRAWQHPTRLMHSNLWSAKQS